MHTSLRSRADTHPSTERDATSTGELAAPPSSAAGSEPCDPRAQKRERILSIAARLFYEGGYRATSMESIAEELGVTKPFLYYHFENKHEILEEIARRVVLLSRSVLQLAQHGMSAPEALASRVRGYAGIARAHKPLLMVLFRETSNFSEATQTLLGREEKAHVEQLAQLLTIGTQTGEFRVRQPGLTAAAILSFVSFGEVFGPAPELPSEELVEEHQVQLALRMAGASDSAARSA